jgi:outer membrane protein assembly factor BamB
MKLADDTLDIQATHMPVGHSTAAASRRTGRQLAAIVLAATVVLGGCSSVRNLFSSKKDAALKPVKLAEFTPSASVVRLWSAKAGKGEGVIGARQGPAIADGRVYAAAVRGGVRAFDLQTGASLWHFDSKLPLSGGPGVGDGLVVAGSLEGDVVALDAATGAQKWTAKVGNEVIAAPTIGQGLVFVHSNDGRVTAFDEASGQRRWFWEHEMPQLTVRGNDAPVLGPGYVFIGNDDGTVAALAVSDGHPVWQQAVAEPEGRTELERMSDVDGSPVLDDTTLYATSFKGKTVALDAPSGRPSWTHDTGGPGRPAVSADRVVVTGASGTVWGLDKAGGSGLWQQDGLLRRNTTAPAIQGEYAVVGDFDGYLHWLKLSDGSFAARMRVSKDPVRAAPVVSGGILVVQDTDGTLDAYRLGQ